ncbi:MAG TPA: VWA domain-containing protein [Conexibacter sp.]|jgi:hypothetical protein
MIALRSEPLDLPAFAAAFGRAGREAGLPTSPERAVRLARAVELARPTSRDRLYWVARAVFVSGPEQAAAFDALFAWLFDGLADSSDPLRGDPNGPARPGATPGPRAAPHHARPLDAKTRPAHLRPPLAPATLRLIDEDRSERDADSRERDLPIAAASDLERLAKRNFSELDADELRALRRLMGELSLAPPLRRSRRSRRAHHGDRLDVRATLRTSVRTGGDPAVRVLRRRLLRPRKLVVLLDVSGSMEPYARAFVQLLHAAVGGADAEAFVFATRLTRVTRALRTPRPDAAIERATAAARDWSGGTRIGEALKRFADDYGRRGMARGAVVVIVSDGWERGDPALLARELQRLRRMAYRIVWVNPRKASRGFEPSTAGMAAALPYSDAFVSGHSAQALREVAAAIGGGSVNEMRRKRR